MCRLSSADWKERFCNTSNLEGFGPGVQGLDLVLCMGVMAWYGMVWCCVWGLWPPQDARIAAAAPAPPKLRRNQLKIPKFLENFEIFGKF